MESRELQEGRAPLGSRGAPSEDDAESSHKEKSHLMITSPTLGHSDETLTSLCVRQQEGLNFVKYFRFADVVEGRRLVGASRPTSRSDVPEWLFNPLLNQPDRASDLAYLRWGYGQKDSQGRFRTEVVSQGIPTPIEVVMCMVHGGETSLRAALSDGFIVQGKPTEKFLLVFEQRQHDYLALLLHATDFEREGRKLKIRSDVQNQGQTLMTADAYLLPKADIVKPPFESAPKRYFYSYFDTPTELVDTYLLRDLCYYAGDYVKYFAKRARGDISKDQRRKLEAVVMEAFETPDYIERYFDASVFPQAEIDKFVAKVSRLSGELAGERLVMKALEDDAEFRGKCVEILRDTGAKELSGLSEQRQLASSELDGIRVDLKKATEELKAKHDELNLLKEKCKGEETRLETLRAEVLNNERLMQEAVSEASGNLALRLGLSAVCSGRSSAGSMLAVEAGRALDTENWENADLVDCVKENLISLGVSSFASDCDLILSALSLTLVSAASACPVVAVPGRIAAAAADALSCALYGCSASRVVVPNDWDGFGELSKSVSESDGVVLAENVIDSVNEPVLSYLLSRRWSKVVVLPFSSGPSLSLVAPDFWDRVPIVSCPDVVSTDLVDDALYRVVQHSPMPVGEPPQKAFSCMKRALQTYSGAVPRKQLAVLLGTIKAFADEASREGHQVLGAYECWAAAQLVASAREDSVAALRLAAGIVKDFGDISDLAREVGVDVER